MTSKVTLAYGDFIPITIGPNAKFKILSGNGADTTALYLSSASVTSLTPSVDIYISISLLFEYYL
jgi:hypothetical protein